MGDCWKRSRFALVVLLAACNGTDDATPATETSAAVVDTTDVRDDTHVTTTVVAATTATTDQPIERRRVLKAGRLIFNDRRSVVDCTVRALWEQGAELQLASAQDIPSDVTLELRSTGHEWLAQIVQRRPDSLELAFA